MKKIIVSLLVILFNLFYLQAVLAAGSTGPAINTYTGKVASGGGYGSVTNTTLSETIGQVIKVVLSVTGTIFLALTVYAGILWMTAGGNDEQVSKATKILYTSVIGLIIVLAAYGITTFVMWAAFGAVGEKTCPWGPGTC